MDFRRGVDAREQQLLQLSRLDARHRLLLRDEALFHHVDRDVHRGLAGALGGAGLQHVQLAALDRELEVLHVLVVLLQLPRVALELRVDLRHVALQRADRLGVAHARDDVLALRIGQVVAVQLPCAGDGVAREGDARAGGVAHVAEHHHLHVYRGAEVVRDALEAAVGLGAVGVPRLEHGVDRLAQLLDGVRGELVPRLFLIYGEESGHQQAQVLGLQLGVGLDPRLLLRLLKRVLELVAVDSLHGLPEHLDEAAPGVESEPLVLRQRREALHGLFVQAEVEDCVHHPGHGELGTRTHADQQGVFGVAELLLRLALEDLEVGEHLLPQALREFAARSVVSAAGLGRDGEARRHGHTRTRHLRGARALASEEVAHFGRAFGELVHPFTGLGHGDVIFPWIDG